MLTIKELYQKVALASKSKITDEDLEKLQYDPYHLECVLHPEFKTEWNTKSDAFCTEGKYFINCLFNHLKVQDSKYRIITPEGKCQYCFETENVEKVISSKDSMAALEAVRDNKRPVYALIAPAFSSQFNIVSDGQLRSAFKQIGFAGMVEVSLLADILTLKEALEFDKEIHNENDFQLTSCCCPIWINLIRKMYPEFLSHVPNSVSPMIATGRVIKALVPDAFTVFIGPCLAKKAEAKEEDIKDAIDVVLTFQEVNDIFASARINAEKLPVDLREHSSAAGRIYAITSGVSEAVSLSVKRLKPDRPIQVKAVQADGVPGCRDLLKELAEGKVKANFLEGMGCVGGCVGGPRAIIDKDKATGKVKKYAYESLYASPIDNPYVIELLSRIGINTIEELIEENDIFTRHF